MALRRHIRSRPHSKNAANRGKGVSFFFIQQNRFTIQRSSSGYWLHHHRHNCTDIIQIVCLFIELQDLRIQVPRALYNCKITALPWPWLFEIIHKNPLNIFLTLRYLEKTNSRTLLNRSSLRKDRWHDLVLTTLR